MKRTQIQIGSVLIKLRTNTKRTNKGASLALVAVCACLLVVCLVACFQLALILGGAQELNYTADAGALSIAKRSVEMETSPGGLYEDCTNSRGGIGLANINRVAGKNYLINANVEEMTADQEITEEATKSGDYAYDLAQYINDDLYKKLTHHSFLNSLFDQIAGRRLHRMLGNMHVGSSSTADWSTALAFRGDESNLAFTANQVPEPTEPAAVGKGGQTFLQGYRPMQANNKYFYFVAFHIGEIPHLISPEYFHANIDTAESLPHIKNPIPNAFSAYGTSENSMGAEAFAIANPLREYKLSIPHSFVSIHLRNIAHWFVNDKNVNTTTYGSTPETQWGARQIPVGQNGDYLDGYASLGNEFRGSNLMGALQSMGDGSEEALDKLVQRLQEIKPEFTLGDLQQLLQKQILLPDVDHYVIYPYYASKDNTDPTIKIAPVYSPKKDNNKQQAGNLFNGAGSPGSIATIAQANGSNNLPSWLHVHAIFNPLANEGSPTTLTKQDQEQNSPNYNWETVSGSHYTAGKHWATEEGEINWRPGTGVRQTLGQLTIIHQTYLYFTAQPNQ